MRVIFKSPQIGKGFGIMCAVLVSVCVLLSMFFAMQAKNDEHPAQYFIDPIKAVVACSVLLAESENAISDPRGDVLAQNRKGIYIYVNLDTKLLSVYQDGIFQKSYPCTGGKTATPSPEGTYKVIEKSNWGEGFGGAWIRLNVPFGLYGIHGTIYPWDVGKYNTSKGCIRMLNKDAKELYRVTPYGTYVTIEQQNRRFRELKNGMVGTDVQKVQQALKALGYYKGGIDGKFGENMTRAVRDFQKENQLWQSGYIYKKAYDCLMQQWDELKKTPTQEP